MDGEGILRYANGGRFKGSFSAGKRDGKSIEINSDGTRIDCTYKQGVKHGPFVEYDANGNVTKKGEYSNGRIVK